VFSRDLFNGALSVVAIAVLSLLSACGSSPLHGNAPDGDSHPGLVFSAYPPSPALPPAFVNRPVLPNKAETRYSLVLATDGLKPGPVTVLKAESEQSASLAMRRFSQSPAGTKVQWSWKAMAFPRGADIANSRMEDSATRLILAFAAPNPAALDALSLKDQLFLEAARMIYREEPPFATLTYIWSMTSSPESVLISSHSSQMRKLVVQHGPEKLGQWIAYERDFKADFERVFGIPPGPLIGIAVMTDSDNTKTSAAALFGDVLILDTTQAH
jgi:hypothetical protein